MSKRTQVLAQIATLEKSLTYQRNKVAKHKKYLYTMAKDHWVLLIATLLPAFYFGMRAGKKIGFGQRVQQVIRVGLIAYTSHVKKLLFSF